jgi:protease-4
MSDSVGRKPGLFRRIGQGITTARIVLSNLLFVVLLLFLISLFFRGGEDGVAVPEGAALVLELDGPIVEQSPLPDPLALLFEAEDAPRPMALRDLVETLDAAAVDDRIRALVLDLSAFPGATPATLTALGRSLERFRGSGKPIVVGADNLSQGQYYLASYADQLYLNPMGQILLTGVSIQPLYFADALEKLRLQVHIFRAGTYKSAVEPFIRNDMSPEDREANGALVQGLWQQWRDQVARNRGIEPARLDALIDEYPERLRAAGGDLARLALETGLVDELLSRDAVRARLVDLVGRNEDGDSYLGVGYRPYLRAVRASTGALAADDRARIAVVVAEGTIMGGDAAPGDGVGEPTLALVRRAREDDDIRAIVLRVNSPGGTPFFSEVLRTELELAQLAGKPVVVSMGGVAASGGYWISATADRVLAEPNTLTGSIGVFALAFTAQDSADALGIHADGVGTHALSSAGNPLRALNPALEDILQQRIGQSYQQFLDIVARGRGMAVSDVDAVAQGRVWLGSTAAELGLVDALGGVEEAVAAAAELAGVDRYRADWIELPRSPRELLIERLAGQGMIQALTGVLDGPTARRLSTVSRWSEGPAAWLEMLDGTLGTLALCTVCPQTH